VSRHRATWSNDDGKWGPARTGRKARGEQKSYTRSSDEESVEAPSKREKKKPVGDGKRKEHIKREKITLSEHIVRPRLTERRNLEGANGRREDEGVRLKSVN